MINYVNLECDHEIDQSEMKVVEISKITEDLEKCDLNCNTIMYYGCPTDEGSFKVDNLFTELTTDYQRTIARKNLGIENLDGVIELLNNKVDKIDGKELSTNDFLNTGRRRGEKLRSAV